jgi:two-component system CheB/CheR fusion protein
MEPDETMGDNKPDTRFPIVCIGASAGGLHSFDCFLEALPKDFDFAVVFIQHLSPSHKSLMPEILRSKWRDLEFIEIEDGLYLLPGRIYLCPPAVEVRIHEGAFRVIAKPDEHIHFPIDEFLVSLAEDAAERAVAVVFSGAGTDGVRGIQAVGANGGAVFVQDPATAQSPELLQAAIQTGKVDGVLPPANIATEIVKLFESGAVTDAPDKLINPAELEPFYLLIREKTGLTFNHYKKSVVSRRIRRRMYLHGVVSVSGYLDMVANKDGEAALLASDLMIGVTSFFRDRLAWKALRLGVIEKLLAQADDTPLRVWTPACATGEESYSIAIMLRHELDVAGKKRELQVFATDVNDRALEKAREGKYPASISADVPPEFMRKFFTYSDDGISVTINKEMRQHVIFAKQDLLTDPPFSRLDLVICRNLLIYLEPEAQEKCITLFHYALRPGGYLFLGNAESPGRKSSFFKSLAHKKCRVYEKIEIEPPSRLPLTVPFAAERVAVPIRQQPALGQLHSLIQLSQETLLEEFAPAAVTLDQNYEIIYHNGPTNRYLNQPRGASTHNLLELMPENLRNRIRGAIYRVSREAGPVSIRAGIAGSEGKKRQMSMRVSKIKDNLFLILFRETASAPLEASAETCETVCIDEPAVRQLEIELSSTRQELQTNIEQLKGLNEELQSSNEEQQAANEELETSREELQSLNEELITVNTQLQSKVEEQEETNNDLNNFFASTNLPTIFLDHRFRVKRYTPAITKLIKLIPSDVGRQIIDMSQEFLGPDLIVDAQSVLDNLVPVKKEISINSDWYIRTALPYRTHDNRIEGVVITYNDVTELKKAEEVQGRLAAIIESADDAVIRRT